MLWNQCHVDPRNINIVGVELVFVTSCDDRNQNGLKALLVQVHVLTRTKKRCARERCGNSIHRIGFLYVCRSEVAAIGETPSSLDQGIGTENSDLGGVSEFLCNDSFLRDEALTKLFYLALRNISQKWTMPIRDWKAVLTRFTI